MQASEDNAMAMDSEDTQEATQPQTQETSQNTPASQMNTYLWGFLQPCNHEVPRIDFYRVQLSYTIGRAAPNLDVILKGMKISGKHCQFIWDGHDARDSSVQLADLSSNGTWVNGAKIGKGKFRIIKDGNEIAFGSPAPRDDDQDYRYIYRHVADGGRTEGIWQKYDIGCELGRGSFASVMKACERATGKWFAVKVIHTNKLGGSHANSPTESKAGKQGDRSSVRIQQFRREIEIMEQLHHPNICSLKEVFVEDASVNLVLELVEGGDLLEYILSKEGVSEEQTKYMTRQICEALTYVHGKGIAHRDLKPENIMLTKDNPPVVKVADFGLAKAVDSLTMLRTMCGTPSYLAPEVVLQQHQEGYDFLVDSWSVGVIVFSMLTNVSPFVEQEDQEDIRLRIVERKIDWSALTHAKVSQECSHFIQQMLAYSPRDRMAIQDALNHPWLRQAHTSVVIETGLQTPPYSSTSGFGPTSADASMADDAPGSDDVPMSSNPHQQPQPPASQQSISSAGMMVSNIPGAYPRTGVVRANTLQRRADVISRAADLGVALPQPSQDMMQYFGVDDGAEEAMRRPGKRKSPQEPVPPTTPAKTRKGRDGRAEEMGGAEDEVRPRRSARRGGGGAAPARRG